MMKMPLLIRLWGRAFHKVCGGGLDMSRQELQDAGLNISMIHIDFMIGTDDLAITGITQDGKEVPVFIDGDFAEPFKVS